ncbi:Uncharacterised protein [Legionella feeleii]|uniref:Uncharacterized protein n=1 Tax=Legionella feeleii TaxID=453 RepID=A0A2X1R6F4_9GAMM|nr:Uncharacterised protein [Legionella feeleii]
MSTILAEKECFSTQARRMEQTLVRYLNNFKTMERILANSAGLNSL